MPSTIAGYEYDIFISYRHNDNLDGWVTDFVQNLEKELKSTLKDPVSVYFDTNPRDGLLETHNVDKSLEGKLKCLIFIPILSQTYCDPKSFAWQHEFVAFNKMAKEDQFGRDVKLSNGNVASRILPIKIHDLDAEDNTIIEKEIGGVLRAIEFIYKEPGVNRSLKFSDNKNDNQNKADYRNQVNKVANAAKEIISGIKNPGAKPISTNYRPPFAEASEGRPTTSSPKSKNKFILAGAIALLLVAAGYFLYPKFISTSGSSEVVDKSIAVLPFVNMSSDQEQEYFSDGMMEEILDHLQKVGELQIVSRTTSIRYKGSKLSIKEIADELEVAHILEGSVRKSGDRVKISVQLIDAKRDRHLWSESYERDLKDVFAIQSEVAQHVASILNAEISADLKRRIEAIPTLNTEAYRLYLEAYYLLWNNRLKYRSVAARNLERAIELDPDFAPAYAELGMVWLDRGLFDKSVERQEVIDKAFPLLSKAVSLDPDFPDAHAYLVYYYLWYHWDFESASKELKKVLDLSPSSSHYQMMAAHVLFATGKFKEYNDLAAKAFKTERTNASFWLALAGSYARIKKTDKAIQLVDSALMLFGPSPDIILLNFELERYDHAVKVVDQLLKLRPKLQSKKLLSLACISYLKTGQPEKSQPYLDKLIEMSKEGSMGSPAYFIAQVYATMGKNDLAFQWLNKSFNDHEVEMYWLKIESPLGPLHSDPRWKVMLDKVGFPDDSLESNKK